MIHDVCIQRLPVTFCLDRSGIVGSDGETHQGIFDLSFLTMIPGMTVMAPKSCYEFADMLRFSLNFGGPLAIRYPRGTACTKMKEYRPPIRCGKAECMFREGQILLWAIGSMVETAWEVREKLKEAGFRVSLVNARFAAPLDEELLQELAQDHELIVTMEENVASGGMGEHVAAVSENRGLAWKQITVAIPDCYVEHGSVGILKEELGLTAEQIARKILTSGVLSEEGER